MEEFSIIIIIALLVVIVILISKLKSESSTQNKKLNNNIVSVYKKITELEKRLNTPNLDTSQSSTVIEKEKTPEIKPEPVKTTKVETPKPIIEEKTPPIIKKEEDPFLKKHETLEKSISEKPIKKEPILTTSTPPKVKPIKTQKTDWEKLIGENLLNKIGIGILVIGIGFFVKYAIDQNWIGEFGRVAIGIGVGAIMLAIAHFMRKKYKAFSSVLIGGGIGVFYYTISIAYHDYDIFSQPIAFGIMTLITILSVVLSIIYDKKEIAIIGLIGGFTSPFMVQGETENYVAFFTYIAILNSGMLILSFFKKWNIIQKLAYGFTILFFGGWIIGHLFDNDLPKRFALIMGTIFYLQFLGTSLWYNVKHQLPFKALEFIQILSINALYFLVGIVILDSYKNGNFQGLFTLGLALFNILIFFGLKLFKTVDKGLLALFIGKTISFITLAILLQFDAHYATLFWALESVVLLWLGQQSKQQLLKSAFVIVTGIATVGLIYSWTQQYRNFDSTVVFDASLISHLGIILTYVVSFFLLKNEEKDSDFFSVPFSLFRSTLAFWAYIAFYITVLIKLIIQTYSIEIAYYPDFIIWSYNILMVAIGLTFTKFKKIPLFTEIFSILAVFSIIAFILKGNEVIIKLRGLVLNNDLNSSYFLVHLILFGLIIYLFYLLRKASFQISENPSFHKWGLVILSVFGVTLASMELDHIGVFTFFEAGVNSKMDILHHTQTEGYTTLWGIYSFILMLYGMRKKHPHMRILSLVLFAITLLKLFIFDIQSMSEAGKIIAFISLGVLLLVASFLYQKLKQIIVGEELNTK